MIYFVLVDYFCLSVYFGVAKVTAKIVQASGMTKQNTQFLFFIPERRLSYEKIVQMSEKHQVYLNVFQNAAYLMKIYIKGENIFFRVN